MKPVATHQKLRGGYYTPKPIADFLARWAIRSPATEVLEPSCGDGMLLQAAAETLIECGADRQEVARFTHAVEFDQHEAHKAADRLRSLDILTSSSQIHIGDFFAYCKAQLAAKRLFDAIIGNPPFIRYQNFPEDQRLVAFGLMARRAEAESPDQYVGAVPCGLVALAQTARPPGDGHPG